MDQTNSELSPPIFEVAESADSDIRELAQSYNSMMAHRAANLRRARQFSADVTHELRTPLTILRGETELGLRNDRSQEELRDVLVSNLEEISRMSYLIEDLLLLSKSDLGDNIFYILTFQVPGKNCHVKSSMFCISHNIRQFKGF